MSNASATAIGVATILWLTFTQIGASAVGGYLFGRLRIKWSTVHSDEVYFRDTGHGFLALVLASLVTAALLSTVVGNVISSGVSIAGSQKTTVGIESVVERMQVGQNTLHNQWRAFSLEMPNWTIE